MPQCADYDSLSINQWNALVSAVTLMCIWLTNKQLAIQGYHAV